MLAFYCDDSGSNPTEIYSSGIQKKLATFIYCQLYAKEAENGPFKNLLHLYVTTAAEVTRLK